MIETLLSHGFEFSHDCMCAIPGKIYKKGKWKVKILKRQAGKFHLIMPEGSWIAGTVTELEGYLIHHGL